MLVVVLAGTIDNEGFSPSTSTSNKHYYKVAYFTFNFPVTSINFNVIILSDSSTDPW